MQRREIFKENLLLGLFGRLIVDGLYFQQRKVALGILGRADQSCNGIAGAKPKPANLARGNINVVRARKIGTARRAQEAESILQNFNNTFALDLLAAFCLRLKNGKDLILLAQTGNVIQLERSGDLCKFCGGFGFKL